MISFLRKNFLRPSFLFKPTAFFSGSTNQDIERNKATLASKIIQIIRQSPLNEYQSISGCVSLREKILGIINTYEVDQMALPGKLNIQSAVRNALRKYFIEGVWVPVHLCNQNSFKQEPRKLYKQIKVMNEEVEMYLDVLSQRQLQRIQFRRLSFCPTYFVTGQIFRYIFNPYERVLLEGQYGIGKTYSFILYTLLSEIIFRYRHRYYPKIKITDLSPLINPNIPKVFYWCVDMGSSNYKPQVFNKLIRRYLYELKETEYSKSIFKTKMENDQNIANLFWIYFHIKTAIIMDQISEMASALRENERLKQDHSKQNNLKSQKASETNLQQKTNPRQDKFLKKAKKNYDKVYEYKDILHELIGNSHFDRIIYMTSFNIQRNLLEKLKLLGCSKQETIQNFRQRVFYPRKIQSDISISDTVDLIVFQLKAKWTGKYQRQITADEQNLFQLMSQLLFNNLKKGSFVLISPLSIQQILKVSQLAQYAKLLERKQQNKLDEAVSQILQKMQDHSSKQMKQSLTEFLSNKLPNSYLETVKPIIFMEIWIRAKIICQNNQAYQSKSQEQRAKEILDQFPMFQFQFKNLKYYEKQAIEAGMPRNLFAFQEPRIACFSNPIIFRRFIDSNREILYKAVLQLNQPILKHVYSHQIVLNKFIESVILSILSKSGTNFQYIQSKDTKMMFNFKQIRFKARFQPIPQRSQSSHKQFCFLSSFISAASEVADSKQVDARFNILAFPVKTKSNQDFPFILKQQFQNEQIYYLSKLIGFAISTYFKSHSFQSLTVHAIDVATSQSDYKEKVQRFYEKLASFKDDYSKIKINNKKADVFLNYIVITTANLKKFNCKDILVNKMKNIEKDIQNLEGSMQEEASQKLKVMKGFQLQDFGNLCKISRRKTQNLDHMETFNSISVVSLFDDVQFENYHSQKSIDLELKLIEKLKNEAKSHSFTY